MFVEHFGPDLVNRLIYVRLQFQELLGRLASLVRKLHVRRLLLQATCRFNLVCQLLREVPLQLRVHHREHLGRALNEAIEDHLMLGVPVLLRLVIASEVHH